MRLRWKLGRLVAYLIARCLFNIQIIGQTNLLNRTAQILVSNHRSNIDPFLVGLASGQEVYFMAKEELFKRSKFFSALISFWNAIPLARNERSSEALKKCADLLKRNQTVLIFPEGTRNKFEALQPFKPGAVFLSINNQVPIVPVAISGVREIYGGRITRLLDMDIRKKYIPNLPSKRNITVRFGQPIYPTGFKPAREDYAKFTEIVRKDIIKLLAENEQ